MSEILSLTVGSVLQAERIVEKIGVAPRHLKGRRGTTRWVLVLPELRRALEVWLGAFKGLREDKRPIEVVRES